MRCSIIVHNLNYNERLDDIESFFKQAGEISEIDVVKDNQNRSRGVAIIKYKKPEDARYAVATFNNEEFNKKKIRVDFEKITEINFEEKCKLLEEKTKRLEDQNKQYKKQYRLLEEKYDSLSKQFEDSFRLFKDQLAQRLEGQTNQFTQQIEDQSKCFTQKLENQSISLSNRISYLEGNQKIMSNHFEEKNQSFDVKLEDQNKQHQNRFQFIEKKIDNQTKLFEKFDFYDKCMCNSIPNIKYHILIQIGKEWIWDDRFLAINELVTNTNRIKVEVSGIHKSNPIDNLPCFMFNGENKDKKVKGSQWVADKKIAFIKISFKLPELVNAVVMAPVPGIFYGVSYVPNSLEIIGIDDKGQNCRLKEFNGIEWESDKEKIFPFYNCKKFNEYLINLESTDDYVGLALFNLCKI